MGFENQTHPFVKISSFFQKNNFLKWVLRIKHIHLSKSHIFFKKKQIF